MNNIKQTQVIELSQYTTPVITEQRNEGWVDFGKKNDYYQFLIDRFQNSATNNAVINNICKLIYGRGITALDASKKPTDYANFLSLVSSDDIKRIISDTKMLGQSAIQVHYNKDRSVKKFLHLPVNLIRSEKCNEDGEILGYYYSDNWQKTREYKPIRYDAFGTSKSEVEILMIQPYSAGMKYYSYVDYQGALDYCMLEEKVSEYLINEVSNSFAPTSIINFNNGQASPEQKRQISEDVTNKLTGSTGKKVIISFNDNPEAKTTIDTIQLQKAADQYQYLSDESRNKILVGHNVTSPLLFGIATSTGFSSNADELKNSAILFDNMVIRPYQELIVEAFDKILAVNNISLKLEFVPLQPLDSSGELASGGSKRIIDGINSLSPLVANKVLESMTANEIRGLVGLNPEQGGSDLQPPTETTLSEVFDLKSHLQKIGEPIEQNGWIVLDERVVELEDEQILDTHLFEIENEIEAKLQNKTLLSKLINLVSTGTARPTAISAQDKIIKDKYFKVRYKYTGNKNPERAFCKAMLSADKLYRKEDIVAMEKMPVNPGFGEFGSDFYDIFRFHGGPRCSHAFKRLTMMLDIKKDSNTFQEIGTRAAEIKGFKVTNPYEVSIYPKNLPLKGFSPNNKNLPSDVQ